MHSRLSLILLFLSLQLRAWCQETTIMNVITRNGTMTYPTDEVKQVSFEEKDFWGMVNVKKENITGITDRLNSILDITNDKSNIYNDFSYNSDIPNVGSMKLQSGQHLSVNGNGTYDTYIKDGAVSNDKNFYLYVSGDSALKHIGMSFSFKEITPGADPNLIQPCVLMLGTKNDTWSHIIHIMFYHDHLMINRRDGGEFKADCKNIKGGGRYLAKKIGEQYDASATLKDDTLFIRKPNGEVLVMQNEFFKNEFTTAIWQATNQKDKPFQGQIHEIYAGTSPLVEDAYRTISTIKRKF